MKTLEPVSSSSALQSNPTQWSRRLHGFTLPAWDHLIHAKKDQSTEAGVLLQFLFLAASLGRADHQKSLFSVVSSVGLIAAEGLS